MSSRLVYDAWNRLVEIRQATVSSGTAGTYGTLARYEYNGLHWRSVKTAYTQPGWSTGSQRYFTYNAAWQCVLEEVDDDYGAVGDPPPPPLHGGIDRVVQQVFGLRGINDALYRREDRYLYTPEWYEEVIIGTDPETGDSIYGEPIVHYAEYHDPDGFFDNQAFYQLSDAQFSVVTPADGGGLTAASIDNPYGFCGYSADLETLGINGPDPSGKQRVPVPRPAPGVRPDQRAVANQRPRGVR